MRISTFLSTMLFAVCQTLYAQPINNSIKNVIMPAPTAASLGKYGDIPVSHYTGVPSIDIPIYTVKDGPISLPVSLSYHAGGMKVGELASWVGLGWSLQAGGIITRTVQGKEDERAGGYFSTGKTLAVDANGCVAAPPTYAYLQFRELTADGEPDIFSFSVGGYNGKFFFEADKTNDGIDNPKIVLVPKQDVRIDYQLDGSSSNILRLKTFTIITPDGTRYQFGNIDSSPDYKGIERTRSNPSSWQAASTWYLRRVSSPDGIYNINLDYVAERYRYGFRAGYVNGLQGTPVNGYNENVNYVDGWRLSAITSPTATVTFTAGANREDIDNREFTETPSTNPAKVLDMIDIQSGTFCKRFDLTHTYYVDGSTLRTGNDNEDKRLKLTDVQEKSCDGTMVIPAYGLQYYEDAYTATFLPNRLSAATDHWGFYNGASGNAITNINIPTTKLLYVNHLGENLTEIKGASNRETSEEYMKLGTLKKITYPTGGSTTFEFEANTYHGTRQVTTFAPAPNVLDGAWSTGSCSNSFELVQIGSSIVQTFNDPSNTRYKWETLGAYAHTPSCRENLELEIRIFNNSTGAELGMTSTGVSPNDASTTNDVPVIKEGLLTDLFSNLPAGVPIRLETWGRNVASRLSFTYVTTTTTTGNIKVGGLRIKKVTNNDGVSASNDVVKTYTYHDPLTNPTQSSGLLYNQPIYGHVYSACINTASCKYEAYPTSCAAQDYVIYPFFFENSVVPLGSFEGHHIGYSSVKESFNGTGTDYYNLYKYSNEPGAGFNRLPTPPAMPRITSGQLSAQYQRNAANSNLGYEIYQPKTELLETAQGTFLKFNNYFAYGDPSVPIPIWDAYTIATRAFRYETVESFRDGVSTTVTKKYDSPHHLQVTHETFTNSDGKVVQSRYLYPADITGLPPAQLTAFKNLNLLVPLETTMRIGTAESNVIDVKGNKTEFAFFDNSSGTFVSTTTSSTTNFIRPYQFKEYEGTAWVQKGQIDSYHGTGSAIGRAGLPKQFTKTGWQAETYEWTAAGLIKKRTFSNFNWQYEYAANTGLVTKITNPDGQFTEYTYDKLMRLDQIKARGNNVVTTHTYTYPSVNSSGVITTRGNVKASTVYTAVAGSGLGTQEVFQYFDGLGREVETVYKGKATGGKDQILAIGYDSQGRPNKKYEPFASGVSDGSYQDPGTSPHTLTEYEGNPLNRIWKVTPPSWFATTTTYGANTSGDAVKNYNFSTGTSTTFGADLLAKTTVTDGNGNKTITFTDKKGRMLLSRKANSNESSKTDTYYVYDDKDRLVRVIPPGATWGSTELVYTYQYTNNDLISQKKVPGKGYEAFEYNSRDLPVKYQDPILRANSSRWMGSKYDAYGRLTEKGVWASGSGDGIVLTNKIVENIYGTAGIEIDKLKTSKVQAFTVADPVVTPTAANAVLQTTFNYDTWGRISGTTGNNHTNVGNLSAESLAYTYDHGDNILSETRSSVHSGGTTSYVNTRLFDGWSRLTQTSQNLNGAGDKVISQLSYTDKDQLSWKKLGNGLQQIDYGYLPNGLLSNINGTAPLSASTYPISNMLTSLNTPTFSGNNNADLFREVLEYNSLTAGLGGTAQNSGNIGQMIWQVKGRATQAYGFTYDYLDRLTASKFASYTSTGTIDATDYFGETQTFDVRGNISSIVRKGLVKGATNFTTATVDNQTLTIQSGSNLSVESKGVNPVSTSGYGNMDAPHNHLNLPSKFDFGANNRIELLYDGQGRKLRKTATTNNVVTLTQDYLDGIELKNNTVEAVYNEEGRAFNNAGTFRYEFALRDHLGNTRVVFTDKGATGIQDQTEILSETHYYPFGKTMDGAWYNDATAPKYKYLYNGKELNEEFSLNFYDYGARWFDPGMASWWEIDPASENNRRWSPYAYGNNNPIRFIDPDGKESAAYGGFTSSSEIAARHAAAAEDFINRDRADDKKEKKDNSKKETDELTIDQVDPMILAKTGIRVKKGTGDIKAQSLFLLGLAFDITSGGFAEMIPKSLLSRFLPKWLIKTTVAEADNLMKTSELMPTHGLTMSNREFKKFVQSVATNGIDEPIKFIEHNGVKYVVDGHHRLRAANILRIENVPAQKVDFPFGQYKTPADLIYSH